MSRLSIVCLLVTFSCVGITWAADNPEESDQTQKWTYPYTAPESKRTRIVQGINVLKQKERGTPLSTFIEVLGTPDVTNDLRKGFFGLSPAEDGMLARYRQQLSLRAIWYLKKNNANSANLNDSWFAAYVDSEGKGVFKIMKHNIE